MRFLPKVRNTVLTFGVWRSAGIGFRYLIDGNPIPFWRKDSQFLDLLRQSDHRTLLDRKRMFQLYQLAFHCRGLKGDFAEIGVYRGGTARVIGKLAGDRDIHLFDTFEGIPASRPSELIKERDFSDTSAKEVASYLSDIPRVHVHPGLFPGTASGLEDRQFAFVHVDVDIHRSISDACDFFYPRMVPGGVILFDDFGNPTCPGVQAAIAEFERRMGVHCCVLTTGQAFFIKSGR